MPTTRLSYLIFATLTATSWLSSQATERPPNIVFILADDLGWAEPGCYGNGFNETPHIDHLARGGLRFTSAYAAAPVCSPYRASLLTGRHPARVGITDYLRPNSANALSQQYSTLPSELRRLGYTTGMIGKWHLTGYKHHEAEHEIVPRDHGFDWDFARERKGVGNGANFWPYVFRTQPVRWIHIPKNRLGKKEYLTDRMNLEAVDFIERNKDRPFLLYLSHYAPHTILNGRPDLVAKYQRKHKPGKSTREKCYLCQDQGHKGDSLHHWAGDHNPHLAAMLHSIDDGVGMITKKLKELGLDENTIVIFTSDNGGETNVTSNAPWRGGKSQLYEGGIRVPLVVRWPKRVPKNRVCDHVTTSTDFFATLLEAAGRKVSPKETDGQSILAQWKDPSAAQPTRDLFWHYPLDRPHFLGGRSAAAVRAGNWKLIHFMDTNEHELYSLADDLGEKKNLAKAQPQVVERLSRKLSNWQRTISARTPSPPLLTSARKLYFADHFSPGQISTRWFFNDDWEAVDGQLKRAAGKASTRIFLRDALFRDALIRFDFRLGKAQDVRLVTGSGGHYNAVIHIRPDHFYIQTALDRTGPYFPRRHGECAFSFEPDRWYTMTVEFLGDRLVAHVDQNHLAFAQHPVLNKDRKYFAFQVDKHAAAFDNVQILQAARHPRLKDNLKRIAALANNSPVRKSIEEQYQIAKRNAHARLYDSDKTYRQLVVTIDELDAAKKKAFPSVFRSHKEIRKKIAEKRKSLLKNDPVFKERLFATYRAKRAIEEYLLKQSPEINQLPGSRKKRALAVQRTKLAKDEKLLQLIAKEQTAQQKLEQAYPELFTSDDEINTNRRKAREKLAKDTKFQTMVKSRAAAWRAQQDYLHEHDEILKDVSMKRM